MTNDAKFAATSVSDNEIFISRTFQAPRTVVFEAWTKAEHVRRWWDPSGMPLAVCEIDLRPNGAFRWVNLDGGGAELTFGGVYYEIVAPERLIFAVQTLPIKGNAVARLNFSESDGVTVLEMTIAFDSIEDRDTLLEMRMDDGTARTLENLAEYIRQNTRLFGSN